MMRGPHPQSHVTLCYRGHVTNKKRYNSTFTKPMDPKLSRVVAQDEGAQPTKPRDTLTTWSRDKSKTLYLHFLKTCGLNLGRILVILRLLQQRFVQKEIGQSKYQLTSILRCQKKYIISTVKEAAEIQQKACAYKK